ncbi:MULTISPECIES: DUF2726 domain-containing protein [unclassified Halomonas]|uniref:DUF2726 domain-containing protein n=1 Tax=unclassified Halomonas TaxID=2609666 RepID=UPI003CF08162
MDVLTLLVNQAAALAGDHYAAIVLLGLMMVVLAMLVRWLKKLLRRKARYQSRRFLFTKTEWHFASTLQEAIQADWLMMGKVRIADILAVERHAKVSKSDWFRAFTKISSKHIDYVLVSPKTGIIECCIELDDPSHNRKDRIERDVFVNNAFAQAGLPLLRIPTAKHYDAYELRKLIMGSVKR